MRKPISVVVTSKTVEPGICQHWQSRILWLMTIPIWIVAMAIDFAHH